MDTNQYLMYIGKSIDKYKIMGIILLSLGFVGIIIIFIVNHIVINYLQCLLNFCCKKTKKPNNYAREKINSRSL
ncbi:hypothetical protein E4V42_23180 [Clostridium estertheticum]|uniref:Uncharacterized protein n=1 Tax=Clostridium estertheticum TaxID=238834 RepID=A0A5N7IVI1_9CLOT|nr:hypothetical protein [Clostridium estertheticum]MPQ34291.1 hypothetical protein [Clostridium estertheticum]MPQ64953.1 hypothetical protein [Clostridium estertheticum]